MFSLFKKKHNICKTPFEQVYIGYNDDVWFCCDAFWKKPSLIGNLNDASFGEIWNSKEAKAMRKRMINADYSYCRAPLCRGKDNVANTMLPFLSTKKIKYKEKMDSYPRLVFFGTDCECNVRCITCREKLFRLSDEELEKQNEKIEKYYLPALKDAEYVGLSTCGEVFGSRHSRTLVRAINQKYPKIHFNILTNGLLCNKFNCDELGITDKLSTVVVSMHAATKETYDKCVLDSNYDKVIENLHWLKERLDQGYLKQLHLVFVITSINYKEMPAFVELAKQFNATPYFWHYRDWGNNEIYSPESLLVAAPTHPEHQDFINVLKSMQHRQ